MTPLENLKIVNPKADKTILNELGLKDDEIKRNVLKLSGGQQQRVAIGRAILAHTDIILADEPTGNLDKDTENDILNIFEHLAKDENKCIIIVTHSQNVCDRADIVYELKK